MAFPQTRLTMIEMLATGGTDDQWRAFVADYWGPVYGFCLRRGAANATIAEEVTSELFAVLWSKELLKRWEANRQAKLRTLICTVARNLLHERFRDKKVQALPAGDVAEHSEEADLFDSAWAEDLLRRSVDTLAMHYRRAGQGDYLRVFMGRVREGLSIREVAELLQLPESKIDYCYRQVRDRLEAELQTLLREQLRQYCHGEPDADEFALEWHRLGQLLAQHGGIERILAQIDPTLENGVRDRGIQATVTRLTTIRQR